jgi:hypothetical protein
MLRWTLRRERRRQKRNALLLLTATGVIRPVNTEIRYRGTDRLIGKWNGDCNLFPSEAVETRQSIWNTDIKQLWKTYRQNTAA